MWGATGSGGRLAGSERGSWSPPGLPAETRVGLSNPAVCRPTSSWHDRAGCSTSAPGSARAEKYVVDVWRVPVCCCTLFWGALALAQKNSVQVSKCCATPPHPRSPDAAYASLARHPSDPPDLQTRSMDQRLQTASTLRHLTRAQRPPHSPSPTPPFPRGDVPRPHIGAPGSSRPSRGAGWAKA